MNSKNINLQVNGMHCGSCANKISDGIKSIQDDATIEINLEARNVSINYDANKTNASSLQNKIIESGFSIESISLS